MIYKLKLPVDNRFLWLAAVLALPLQPLAFYYVRLPLIHLVTVYVHTTPAVYQGLMTIYAPLTEEPAKLIPLLIPVIRRDIRVENFVRYALAIGLAFAIGEMWFIAHDLARNPAIAAEPFYRLYGYFAERLMTCVYHSAFLSMTLWQLRRRVMLGLAGAMALHWLCNFPIFLMSWNVGELGYATWLEIVNCWNGFYSIACLALLSWFGSRQVVSGMNLQSARF
ncbi:MAG TPA: hypothetical protein VGJ73_02810 [Verrucomicrobiae bacterium]